MSTAYEKVVRGSKLTFKGGGDLAARPVVGKKKGKKKQKKQQPDKDGGTESVHEGEVSEVVEESYQLDNGTGHAPDGKKSKTYEELFPVETTRFGYVGTEGATSREAALDARVKKKADRYCK